jgi:membrane protein implicated in regulation of membrane protease activity
VSLLPPARIPKRPFRDSAIVYAVLASVVVVVSVLTGGSVVRAVLVAAAFFLVATAYSWWRFRRRLGREERA